VQTRIQWYAQIVAGAAAIASRTKWRRINPAAQPRSSSNPVIAAALVWTVVCCANSFAHAPPAAAQAAARDGSHDFDFEIGEWTTHVQRLAHPLSGSKQWVDYQGTSVVKSLLEARANLVELKVQGASGRIEGVSLRLYEPQSHQWTLNFANIADGHLTPPVIGEFQGGSGRFYGQDSLNGRAILVRFIISDITAESCRFEQAFSADGGQSWEINWMATDTRRR
jgi:hypothetical protein